MIPFRKRLSEVYAQPDVQVARYDSIVAEYKQAFGEAPEYIVRAPGRVNLIGDHIDYSYFSVFPMAIEKDVVMAVGTNDTDTVKVVNIKPEFKPSEFSFSPDGKVEIDSSKLEWVNYFKCGFVVASKYLKSQNPDIKLKGLTVSMDGNVPAGGGLSSSAAFVVSATLATLVANGFTDVPKKLLTQLSITCEQLLGVNSGGMDQAASIFGEKGSALMVEFRPELAASPKQFPDNSPLAFLIANSLVVSNKHETVPVCYNLRVVEVTVAAQILAKKLGVEIPQDGNLNGGTLRGVLEAKFGATSEKTLEDMLPLVDRYLNKAGYTEAEAAQELGISNAEFKKKFLSEFPVRFEKLKLYQRAKHVYTEALRVLQFDTVLKNEGSIAELGALMNASHDSAREMFENSHTDVDEMVNIALAAGAAGSRVTGAGWGGCTVHLVPVDKVPQVEAALQKEYYDKLHPNGPDDALIVTRPGSGAVIIDANVSL